MSFNISDFLIKDIIYTAKEKIEGTFFKVTIENVDYPVLISRVGASLIGISIYCMRSQVNDENPIEKKIIEYNDAQKEEGHDYLLREHGSNWNVDFFDPEKFFFRTNLYYIFEESNFEFSDVNEKTNDFLNSQMLKEQLIYLTYTEIIYKGLQNPTCDFEKKLRNILLEKCSKQYVNNIDLQNTLIEVKNKQIEYEKEKEERMKLVREKEREIQEYNDNLEVPKRKNLKDYNIR